MPFIQVVYDNAKAGYRTYRLYFKDGQQIVAKYDCDADSDNGLDEEDVDYEEFYEFYFEVLKVEKKTDNSLRKGKYISLNYHNFPIRWEVLSKEEAQRYI